LGQSKFHDPLDSIHPTEILIPDLSSEIEVLEEVVPQEDTFGFVPPTEEPAVVVPHFETLSGLRVTKWVRLALLLDPQGWPIPP